MCYIILNTKYDSQTEHFDNELSSCLLTVRRNEACSIGHKYLSAVFYCNTSFVFSEPHTNSCILSYVSCVLMRKSVSLLKFTAVHLHFQVSYTKRNFWVNCQHDISVCCNFVWTTRVKRFSSQYSLTQIKYRGRTIVRFVSKLFKDGFSVLLLFCEPLVLISACQGS